MKQQQPLTAPVKMPSEQILTFIDFQNDFVAPGGVLTFDNGKGDTALINRTRAFFQALPRGYFTNAIITLDTHFSDTYAKSEERKSFPLHCVPQTKGWELAIDKKVIESKIPVVQYVRKNTYDMWAGTIDTVQCHIPSIKEVVLFGVASDICNKAAVAGWLKRGVSVTILEDLTRGIYKQTADVLKEEPFRCAVQNKQLKTITAPAFLQRIQHERN